MSSQPSIDAHMRTIVVDWLVKVQEAFEFNHETLELSVLLMDRYLTCVDVKQEDLQLVAITCTLIAAKFEVLVAIIYCGISVLS